MAARVAINGFGRIGRNILRAALKSDAIEVVAINDLGDASTLAHLFKYDSIHGPYAGRVDAAADSLVVDGRTIRMLQIQDPAALPWRELAVDIAIEATGCFTDRASAGRHLEAGAGRVIVSAPCRDADVTLCLGVNQEEYDPRQHAVISNASCTTNCLTPVAKVLLERFGIVKGMMNTVHSYTNGQSIIDQPHPDPRRGRAAGLSMIPTTTGATKAAELVLPKLAGKLQGMAVRVPTPNVSLIDLVVETQCLISAKQVNAALREAAEGELEGILEYCELPLVSRDFLGNPASSIVDGLSTATIGGNMVRIIAWYDNETGYSHRVVDLAKFIAGKEFSQRDLGSGCRVVAR
jgi:glyceraldehyde 3-phosphate dehydrogenase